jgi:hypothetical protein
MQNGFDYEMDNSFDKSEKSDDEQSFYNKEFVNKFF